MLSYFYIMLSVTVKITKTPNNTDSKSEGVKKNQDILYRKCNSDTLIKRVMNLVGLTKCIGETTNNVSSSG